MEIMFSRKDQLERKTGPEGIGRFDFLKQLVEEYHKTTSYEAKQEVLANLANFAYDPINYSHIRHLRLLDIFLAQLSQNKEELLHFALAGLCNLSSDPENKEYIIRSNGLFLVSEQLLHRNEEIALNALTTLIFLITPESQINVTTPCVIAKVLHYSYSPNPRFKNLAEIFLSDFCTSEQIAAAKSTSNIPLP